MPEDTDLFEIIPTTRAMRRLKTDPVPDELVRKILEAGVCAASGGNNQRWRFMVIKDRTIKEKVQVWYQKAFDEVVGPRYRGSEPPPGSNPARYRRQHNAVEYLTEHYHEAPSHQVIGRLHISGGAEHVADRPGVGLGRHADHQAFAPRKRSGSHTGSAARSPFLCHPADRVSDWEFRTRGTRPAR